MIEAEFAITTGVAGLAIGLIIGLAFGLWYSESAPDFSSTAREVISRGHAEIVLNEKGKAEFKWKCSPETPFSPASKNVESSEIVLAARQLVSLPDVENRIGNWKDVQIAFADLRA